MPNDRIQPFNGAKLPFSEARSEEAPSRSELFRQAGKKLRQEFHLRFETTHPNDAAGALRDFLAAHLPRRFGLGFGHLIDSAEQTSPFCEAVIYDALNCPSYPAASGSIYPCEGVAAVIEVRSTL